MGRYTNATGVSLPLAVWLATDNYDGKPGTNPYQISATSLLKSPRQIVLGLRAKPEETIIDVASIIKSRIGSAIHDSIEAAWSNRDRVVKTIIGLNYSSDVANKIQINPSIVTEGSIPVYMEQRAYKTIGKWTLTGKFDFVINGRLTDFKSTGTFTYVNKTKDDDYIKQGSIYRWLNPDKITDDSMTIDFIFMDWKAASVNQANYPPAQTVNQMFPLMPIKLTEQWIQNRLDLIETLEIVDETDLPNCTDTELWRRESIWKYYSSGQITARSTKNFDNASEAYARQLTDGNKGLVVEIKGAPTACLYCDVANDCSQKDAYIASGELVI